MALGCAAIRSSTVIGRWTPTGADESAETDTALRSGPARVSTVRVKRIGVRQFRLTWGSSPWRSPRGASGRAPGIRPGPNRSSAPGERVAATADPNARRSWLYGTRVLRCPSSYREEGQR